MNEIYKRLKQRLASVNLESALVAVWHYYQHIAKGAMLPPSLRGLSNIKDTLQVWQLLLLLREVVRSCRLDAKTAFCYETFAHSMNDITDIIGALDAQRMKDVGDVDQILRDINSLAHQQFRFQKELDVPAMLRYFRVFGSKDIDALLEKKLGLNFAQCYFFMLRLVSNFDKQPGIVNNQGYEDFGISFESATRLYDWISCSTEDLRLKLVSSDKLDANWALTWNPLEAVPLIRHDSMHPERMYCPIPSLVWHKLGSGLFYDLVNEKGFSQVYGNAFERYVGEFARSQLPGPLFGVSAAKPYIVAKQRKDGADWMIDDSDAAIFVECKTKRISHAAKLVDNDVALREQLGFLADAVVQLYKNIEDARLGLNEWDPLAKRVYPLIVTLESWYLFSPAVKSDLNLLVASKLADAGLNTQLVADIPFTIASCQEYEWLVLAIRKNGINSLFQRKVDATHFDWMLAPFLQTYFAGDIQSSTAEAYAGPWRELLLSTSDSWSPWAKEHLKIDFDVGE
jgi:hypothetical protein